jgi:hypothetical protein
MSKLTIQGALCTLVLFAAVAVFSSVVQASSADVEQHNLPASQGKGAGSLIADGTDPYPRPPMPPAVAS